MTIKIKLDTAQIKKEGHPLILYIYVSDKDKSKSYTGYYSTADMWDFDKEEPKKNHPLRIGIMNFILETKLKINKILNLNKKLTSKQIYDKIYGKDDDFIWFWDNYIKELRENGRDGNADFNKGNFDQVKKFKSEIKFSEIDYNFLTKFKNLKRKTCNSGGINVYLRAMRTVYNEGIKRGVYVPETFVSPFAGIMEKPTATKNKNLTLSEMKLIFSKDINHKYYDYFSAMFLIGGVDFIDIANLKKEHIVNGRLRFERFKGGTHEIVDNKIFPELQVILDKYESASDYLFPIHQYSYKKYRDSFSIGFRKILNDIGVGSYFSSKSARYTFINIAKELEVNREVVKELIGHNRKSDMLSVYEGSFTNKTKDEVHRAIIDAVLS